MTRMTLSGGTYAPAPPADLTPGDLP